MDDFIEHVEDVLRSEMTKDVQCLREGEDAVVPPKRLRQKGESLSALAHECVAKSKEGKDYRGMAVKVYRAAVKAYDEAIAQGDEEAALPRAAAYVEVGRVLTRMHHVREAIEAYDKAADDYRSLAEAGKNCRYELGNALCGSAAAHFRAGEYEEAVKTAKKALYHYRLVGYTFKALERHAAEATLQVTRAYYRLSAYDSAEKYLTKALEYYDSLPLKRDELGEKCDADACHAKLLGAVIASLKPFNPYITNTHIGLDKALADFKRMPSRDDPEYLRVLADYHYMRALVAFRLGAPEDVSSDILTANALRGQAADLAPDADTYEELAAGYLLISAIHAHFGAYQAAQKSLGTTINILEMARNGDDDAYYADLAAAYYDRGCLHLFMKEYADAVTALGNAINESKKALRIATPRAAIRLAVEYDALGDVYAKVHNHGVARVYYDKALEYAENYRTECGNLISEINLKMDKLN